MIQIEKETEIYKAAVKHFGGANQVLKAIEELSELARALVQDEMGVPKANIHVEEEIADVEIMLNQLRLLYDPREIDDWKDSKLERLAGMVGVEIGEEGATSFDLAALGHLPLKGKAEEDDA